MENHDLCSISNLLDKIIAQDNLIEQMENQLVSL